MHQSQRDAGLVRAVGTWALAAGMLSMIVGAGIFVVPGLLAASVGVYAPLVFLVCGLAVGAVAICFAAGGSRIPTSGGVYGLIEAAFGPFPAFVVGTLLWVGCVLANGGVAAALADATATLFPASLTGLVRPVVIVGTIGGIAALNVSSVSRGARLVAVTTTLKLAPLVLFIIAGATALHRPNFSLPVHVDVQGLGRAVILAVFAFIGMETPLCASGEVLQPSRTIPRALAITVISVTTLYALIQFIAQGTLGPALATSKAPLADAMAQIHPLLRAVMLTGTVLSMFGYLAADIFGSPRQIFALARDGMLPSVLGKVRPRGHAPYTAIACYAALSAVLGLASNFSELAVLSALAIAPLYAVGSAAAWVLARRGVALAGEPLNFRFLGTAAVIASGTMVIVVALASREELLGLAALLAVSTVTYFGFVRSARGLRRRAAK